MTGGSDIIDVALNAGHGGWRLDRALADALPTFSRERLKSLVKSGALEHGGHLVRDPALKVDGSEAYRLTVPQPTRPTNAQFPVELLAPECGLC